MGGLVAHREVSLYLVDHIGAASEPSASETREVRLQASLSASLRRGPMTGACENH